MKTRYWSYLDFGEIVEDTVYRDGHVYFAVKSDITGKQFLIEHGLEDLISYHDKHDKEQLLTKTEIANIFVQCARTIMTVNFNKQLKKENVIKAIKELYPNERGNLISKSDYCSRVDEVVKGALDGEERTMIGRHYGVTDDLGYVRFIDMELENDESKGYDTRIRLVDPNRINWFIANGTKYTRKK